MKLWLITRTDSWGYDDYDSAVVAAENETQARSIDPSGCNWTTKYPAWCSSPEKVSAKYLGEAAGGTEPGVILASYNAG